jgi:hypothetical protein
VYYKQIKFDVVTKKLLDNNTELKENKEGKFDQKHVLDESGWFVLLLQCLTLR